MVSLFRVDRRHQGRLCQHLTRNLPFIPCWSQQTCRRGGRALEERLCGFAASDKESAVFQHVRLSRQPSLLFQSSTVGIKPVYLVFFTNLMMSAVAFFRRIPGPGIPCLVDCLQRNRDPLCLQENSLIKFVFTRCPATQWEERRSTRVGSLIDEKSRIQSYESEMYGFLSSTQPLFWDLDSLSLDQTGSHPWWKPPVVALCTDPSITGGGSLFCRDSKIDSFWPSHQILLHNILQWCQSRRNHNLLVECGFWPR